MYGMQLRTMSRLQPDSTPRASRKYSVAKMPRWTCPECLKHATLCMFCGEGKPADDFHKQELHRWRRSRELSDAKCSVCKAANQDKRSDLTCSRCSELLPQLRFDTDALNTVLSENRIDELYCVK